MKAAETTTHLSILRVQKGFTTKSKLFSICDTPFSLTNDEIILVRQSGDLDSYSGWDLFCSLQDAHDIFMNLAHHPSTVVIGYAEEAKMELSLNPPCPVFPISYPDTDQGNEYWNDTSQWKVLHHYISKNCRKRLNLAHDKRVEVDDMHGIHDGSSTLLSFLRKLVVAPSISEIQSSVDGEGIKVVVVRGIYGQPFLQLLEQCHAATFAAKLNVMPNVANKQIAQGRRHRRKSLDPYKLRFANRTSEKVAKSRMEHAKVLASNLSLPALLRCHLQVYGRGTLSPMDAICTSQDSNETNPTMDLCIILGVVLYGSFSEVTGFAEGFGFISAAKLLEYLSSCRHPPLMVKSGKPCLLTQVKREPTSKATKALLSLLL
jgi:POPLD (NUC188) domain